MSDIIFDDNPVGDIEGGIIISPSNPNEPRPERGIRIARNVKIIVEKNNNEFNTKNDWGFYLQNFNCIGDPIQQTTYIQVPASDKQIDISESLSGRPTYISRPITLELAGKADKYVWDAIISAIRNNIEGQICKIIFSNDASYYWQGRVHLVEFGQECGIGHFTLSIPEADPYKYTINQSVDRWEWNPFSFLTGVVTKAGYIDVNGTRVVEVPTGHMEVVPIFNVKKGSVNLKVTDGKTTKSLRDGNNRDPRIRVNGTTTTTLTFTGIGSVAVVYRGGSL